MNACSPRQSPPMININDQLRTWTSFQIPSCVSLVLFRESRLRSPSEVMSSYPFGSASESNVVVVFRKTSESRVVPAMTWYSKNALLVSGCSLMLAFGATKLYLAVPSRRPQNLEQRGQMQPLWCGDLVAQGSWFLLTAW